MSDGPFTPAARLDRAETSRRLFCHVMPEGRDWHDALEPRYWFSVLGGSARALNRIEPGDRIEVYSFDKTICFELFILEANQFSDPPRVSMGARPIWPVDLPLPKPETVERAPFRIRVDRLGGYEVVEDATGEVMASGLVDRQSALQAAANFANRPR